MWVMPAAWIAGRFFAPPAAAMYSPAPTLCTLLSSAVRITTLARALRIAITAASASRTVSSPPLPASSAISAASGTSRFSVREDPVRSMTQTWRT
eukprot:CAMPEP_0177791394 /NCGR_PEP_ID=MMETSP0491_2-20121128/23901_1 /TAXON_ID=63592 /ORGANISM="Tetraselmis chuii, Strain PLY429" /LENGTH=94 /DNA_ID=CAMNT_0019313605 /DNA_START=723 /DNA_END=1007 /DNA_ORIENTATION=-